MAIDPDRVLRAQFPPMPFRWSPDDVIRYHLGLGAGAPRCDGVELRYVYEESLQVLGTFAAVAASTASTVAAHSPELDHDPVSIVHVGQEVQLFTPVPASGESLNTARVTGVYDKGRSALVEISVDTTLGGGTMLARTVFRLLLPGEGGFGGDRGPSGRTPEPDYPADVVHRVPTLPQQAALYRMSGDRTRLHIDPSVARRAGHPRPTLQGLCTWGMVAKTLVDRELDGDAARLRAIAADFTGPVYPGETLAVPTWRGEGELRAVARVLERDAPALGGIRVRYHF